MSQITTWIKGRTYRHGYRVEGEFIKRHYGKDHLFFQSADEAMTFFKNEAETVLTHEVRTEDQK